MECLEGLVRGSHETLLTAKDHDGLTVRDRLSQNADNMELVTWLDEREEKRRKREGEGRERREEGEEEKEEERRENGEGEKMLEKGEGGEEELGRFRLQFCSDVHLGLEGERGKREREKGRKWQKEI